MEFQITEVDGVTIVAVSGELDGLTAPAMQDEILPLIHPGCKILLDMSGVSYISSVGLRALLLLYRKTEGNQGHIALSGLSEMIHDTMLITGFLDFFEAYDTVETGLAALN
ncbi:MAG: anti-sigma factor antagonist [Anaerolineaceae bacterium]|jgi:anti-sigma B factor antagonist|nr:anti-sigma factor antagonist [Chloroflexota bacterium]UCC54037.1 MAG: anti-sigma factor antagonist [Anaerolineaceae bacterium]